MTTSGSNLKSSAATCAILLALVLLGGCAVGPNFHRPAPPPVGTYTAASITNTHGVTNIFGGESQHLLSGKDIPGQWWTLFHSPALNALIERALCANPNLKAAQAALWQARENVRAQHGAFFPNVNGGFSAQRGKTSGSVSPNTYSGALYYTFYTPNVTVSYSPDVFGLNRRTVESLKAQEEQQRFQLAATYITLSANVVGAAIQEASLRAQIGATTNLIAATTKARDVLQAQFSKGYVNRLDVAAQETQLAQVAATLPALLKQLAQQRDALATLVGAFPSEDPAPQFDLTSLQLPRDLPLSLPAQLVRQRPDVLQAEAELHSASALVGVAIANRLPNIALTAEAGSTALTLDKLFSSGTGFWALTGAVTAPIFDGGTLLHKQHAAQAAFFQAREQYRSTVLSAFQNVADTLNALDQDAKGLQAAAQAETAAKVTLDMTQRQLKAGYANYLTLVTAEAAYQQALQNRVQAQANRFADTAALFLALGGGWWNQPDFTKY
jgi:NodT family efflux transporter outer membrane factor (OMF) lipoprotein